MMRRWRSAPFCLVPRGERKWPCGTREGRAAELQIFQHKFQTAGGQTRNTKQPQGSCFAHLNVSKVSVFRRIEQMHFMATRPNHTEQPEVTLKLQLLSRH